MTPADPAGPDEHSRGLLQPPPPLLEQIAPAAETPFTTKYDRHVIVAFLMVAIAIFGAVTAYRAALAEQRSINLERRLALGRLLDIGNRQKSIAEILVRLGLGDQQDALKKEAADLRATAQSFSKAHGSAADSLELHVSELIARRNALSRFKVDLEDLTDSKMTATQEIADRSARKLRELGIYADVDPDPNAESVLRFPQLEHAIEQAHELGPALSSCVLLFVAALVCLTLAELGLRPPMRWWWLVAAGCQIALVTVFFAVWFDFAALWLIGPLSFLLACGAIFAARRGLFLKAREPEHAPDPEVPEPTRVPFAHLTAHESHDNWSRRIVLLISLAVFVSAFFGWLYSYSLKHAGHFALEAQKMRVELVTKGAGLEAVALGGGFEDAILVLTTRIRCAAATQLATLAADGIIEPDPHIAKDQQQRCDELEKLSGSRQPTLDVLDENDLADSGISPARSLLHLIMDRPGGPGELSTLSDGFAEISAGWLKRAALMVAALTIVAIALYLFGQAYAMGETTAGRWLIRSGKALLGASVALGIYGWVKPVILRADGGLPAECGGASLATAKDENIIKYMAQKYAEGIAAYDRADTSLPGSQEQEKSDREAIASFDCAIRAWPGLIRGFRKYEEVIAHMNSPQREEGYRSLNSKAKLAELHDRELKEFETSDQAEVLRPVSRLGNFAFDSTVLALAEHRLDALADARMVLDTITRQSAWLDRIYLQWMRPELWPEEILWTDQKQSSSMTDWLNLGLSQLAMGEAEQVKAAERTYDKALRQETSPPPGLIASALTDLEILKAYCRNLHRKGNICARISAAIDRIRPRIAAGIWSGDLLANSSVSVGGFEASITPYSASWQAHIDGFDPERDRLTVAWFRDDTAPAGEAPDASKWQLRRALPDLFETYYPGGSKLPAPDAPSNITVHASSYIDAAGSCLSPGRYVAELFLNGALLASVSAAIDAPDLQSFRSRELDLIWCIPRNWEYWSTEGTSHPWLADKPVRGFMLTNGSKHAFRGAIMTFYAPPSMTEDKRRDYFLRRAVQILLRKGGGGMGAEPSSWTQEREDQLVGNAVPIDKVKNGGACQSNAGLEHPVYRFFPNDSDKNTVHIGIVDGGIPAKDVCVILGSLRNYF